MNEIPGTKIGNKKSAITRRGRQSITSGVVARETLETRIALAYESRNILRGKPGYIKADVHYHDLVKLRDRKKQMASSKSHFDIVKLIREPAFFIEYFSGLKLADFQKRMVRHWESYPNTVTIIPRNHGKSTIAVWYCIWKIYTVPNLRGKWVNDNTFQGRHLNMMREIIENNKLLKDFFADIKNMDDWCQDRFSVTRSLELADPTFEVLSFTGGSVEGRRADLLILDDIVTVKNSRNEGMRDKLWEWISKALLPFVEPHTGRVIVLGTPKHYDDMYSKLKDNESWKTMIEPAIDNHESLVLGDNYNYMFDSDNKIIDVNVKGKWNVLWEDRWDIAALLMKQAEIGSMEFCAEYLCDPTPLAGNMFKRDFLNFYDAIPTDYMIVVMGVDPAYARGMHNDYSGIVVAGFDIQSNKIYILDTWHGRVTHKNLYGIIESKAREWKVERVEIETIGGAGIIMQDEFIARTSIPVHAIKVQERSKVERLQDIGVIAEQGRLYIKEDQTQFLKEYLNFPGGHDHLLDSFQMTLGTQNRGTVLFA